MCGRNPRLLPDEDEGDGWRASGDEALRVITGSSFGCKERHEKGQGGAPGRGEMSGRGWGARGHRRQ
jgi:hypothetical protein